MSDVFDFTEGTTALLVSVPHDGRALPRDVEDRMAPAGLAIPDTDWHVARLYEFVRELGASCIVARFSRYVVDLNRPADDASLYDGQVATGLCPAQTFAGEAIYRDGSEIDGEEKADRTRRYWSPYHEHIASVLQKLRRQHGYALLWDAHSIPSRVPRLFEGELPVLNLGTFGGESCDPSIAERLFRVASDSGYSAVIDARFKGGYITRHYGRPDKAVHAVQLELSQRAYMDERSREYDLAAAAELRDTLRRLIETYLESAKRLHT